MHFRLTRSAPTLAFPGFSGAVLLRSGGTRQVTMTASAADLGEGHRWNTASLTKLITAIAVCRVIADRHLELDGRLARWIPESVPFPADQVRIEHLLSHTAGLPEQGEDPASHDAVGWLGMAQPLEAAPGTRFGYSNIGYALLGAVLERALGTSYYAAVDELVLGPAGMVGTSFDGPPGADRGDPFGYAWSTIEDLERLVDHLAGHRLLDVRMTRRIIGGGVPTGEPGREAGFGMFLDRVGGVAISTTAGAGVAASAWLDLEPERGYLAIVLSDQPKPAAHQVGAALRARYLLGDAGSG